MENQSLDGPGRKIVKNTFLEYTHPTYTPEVNPDDIIADLIQRGAMEVVS